MKTKYWLFISGAVFAGIVVYRILNKITNELEDNLRNEEIDEEIAKWGVGS